MTVAGIVEPSIAIGDSCHSLNRQVKKKIYSLHQKHYFGSMIKYSFIKHDNITENKYLLVPKILPGFIEGFRETAYFTFSLRTDNNKLRT